MSFISVYIRLVSTVIFILLACNKSSAQATTQKFNRDSAKRITLNGFNDRVDRALLLLKTRDICEISDTDHINIMMCLNTICFTHLKERGPMIDSTTDGHLKAFEVKIRFAAGRFSELEKIADKTYVRNIIKVYPEWVPNRGMGFYFPHIKMELYGTPSRYAMFDVSE
jgi:hypothetical protein